MVKHSLLLVSCFSCLITSVYANPPGPGIELLEYLADMETVDDEWVDPLLMKELANNQIDEPTQEQGNE